MKRLFSLGAALCLTACGGGSTTGGDTAESPFVGTYSGSSTVTVSAPTGRETVGGGVSIFVHRDGLVQFGDAESTIYASGPLDGNSVRIEGDATTLIDPDCEGIVIITGRFSLDSADGAGFNGDWSSRETSCFGVDGTVSGRFKAERVRLKARASRVFETNSEALRRAFRAAVD